MVLNAITGHLSAFGSIFVGPVRFHFRKLRPSSELSARSRKLAKPKSGARKRKRRSFSSMLRRISLLDLGNHLEVRLSLFTVAFTVDTKPMFFLTLSR
jgi:hypothetical protein